MALLARLSGVDRPHLGQGAVFAAKARDYSGHIPEHTGVALHALAGMTVEHASALADDVAVDAAAGPDLPAYELWRARVRDRVPATDPATPA